MASKRQLNRFLDAAEEPIVRLPVLPGGQVPSDESLRNSLRTVWHLIPNLEGNVQAAGRTIMKSSRSDLTDDEIAAIRLYAIDGDDPNRSIITQLNRWLRSEDRKSSEPWSSYLNLLLGALNKLPSVKKTVYRLAHGNVIDRYREHQELTWWGVNSCVSKIEEVYTSQMVYERQTLFIITCIHGKDISHLTDSSLQEIVLLPETHLRVNKMELGSRMFPVIRLDELPRSATHRPDSSLTPLISSIHSETSLSTDSSHGRRTQVGSPDRIDKTWFDRQFHSDGSRSIVRPDELEKRMSLPPVSASDPNLLNRIRGSIVGLALGDALGAHVEFRPREFLLEHPVTDLQGGGTWGLQKGQFTDDTSMALCLGISLVCRAGFHPYDQLVRYKWWYRDGYMSSTGKCFDIGTATSEALQEFEHRQELFAYQHKIPLDQMDHLSDSRLLKDFNVQCSHADVAGNGALMRLAPVSLFFYRSPADAVNYSGLSAELTHGDPKARDACRYYSALMVAVLRREQKNQLLSKAFYEDHRSWFGSVDLVPEIKRIAKGSYQRRRGYDDGIRGKGYIVDALEAALWAFWSTENFRDGARAAVNLGDDTDTTAAIYGQLAGAFYGYDHLPAHWVEDLYAKEFLLCLSVWIEYEGELWRSQ